MTAPSREREREIITVLAGIARRRGGLDCSPFIQRVELALRRGAALYGDRLAGRDLLGEAMEEPVDTAGWLLLLLQRDSEHMPREARDDVLAAIVLSAIVDAYLRRAARRLHAEHGAHRDPSAAR